jgi:hypothetical protein
MKCTVDLCNELRQHQAACFPIVQVIHMDWNKVSEIFDVEPETSLKETSFG